MAAWNLLRLASFLDKPELRERAAKVFEAFSERLAKIPMALPEMASAFLFNPTQIIITGESTYVQGSRAFSRYLYAVQCKLTLLFAGELI